MLADVPFMYVFIGACCIGGIIGLLIGFLRKKYRKNDNIYFLFYGTKGDEYRASYPLARLKEQYTKLK